MFQVNNRFLNVFLLGQSYFRIISRLEETREQLFLPKFSLNFLQKGRVRICTLLKVQCRVKVTKMYLDANHVIFSLGRSKGITKCLFNMHIF